jgi:hypothetical protein
VLVTLREGDRGDCVRPPSLAYALVTGDIGGAVVAGAGPAHLGAEDDEVTLGGTPAAAGRAGRLPQRSAVRNAGDI